METGTGKTYVYLRTIFELNRRYGFTKFVIVVPSVAIKEGVYKTLQITEEHFRTLYANVPFSDGNNYFIYDSAKLGQVRNFATSPHIQVMVVTVGAINKFGDEAEADAEEADEVAPAGEDEERHVSRQREDRRREADRSYPGHSPDPDRGRAAERRWRPGRAWPWRFGANEPAVYPALLRHPCR